MSPDTRHHMSPEETSRCVSSPDHFLDFLMTQYLSNSTKMTTKPEMTMLSTPGSLMTITITAISRKRDSILGTRADHPGLCLPPPRHHQLLQQLCHLLCKGDYHDQNDHGLKHNCKHPQIN